MGCGNSKGGVASMPEDVSEHCLWEGTDNTQQAAGNTVEHSQQERQAVSKNEERAREREEDSGARAHAPTSTETRSMEKTTESAALNSDVSSKMAESGTPTMMAGGEAKTRGAAVEEKKDGSDRKEQEKGDNADVTIDPGQGADLKSAPTKRAVDEASEQKATPVEQEAAAEEGAAGSNEAEDWGGGNMAEDGGEGDMTELIRMAEELMQRLPEGAAQEILGEVVIPFASSATDRRTN
eukprot:3707726-Rhodomonas_salina.3